MSPPSLNKFQNVCKILYAWVIADEYTDPPWLDTPILPGVTNHDQSIIFRDWRDKTIDKKLMYNCTPPIYYIAKHYFFCILKVWTTFNKCLQSFYANEWENVFIKLWVFYNLMSIPPRLGPFFTIKAIV